MKKMPNALAAPGTMSSEGVSIQRTTLRNHVRRGQQHGERDDHRGEHDVDEQVTATAGKAQLGENVTA
jgi:hypothetical protein